MKAINNKFKISDEVILLDDIPEHGLLRGQVGKIVAGLQEEEKFRVDFTDSNGRVYVSLPVPEEHLLVLRRDPGVTMTEDCFWTLIEETKAASNGDDDKQVEILIDKLANMTFADLFAFGYLFDKFHEMAYRWDLWAAADIISSPGDDGFMDFRAWLISRGKTVFFNALRDPDTLAGVIDIAKDDFSRYSIVASLEKMNYVTYYAYEKKTGGEPPTIFGSRKSSREPLGEDLDYEAALLKYPKLAAKFGP